MDTFLVIIALIGVFASFGLLQVIKNYNKSIPEGRKTVSLTPKKAPHSCIKLLLQGQNRCRQHVHYWESGSLGFLLDLRFIKGPFWAPALHSDCDLHRGDKNHPCVHHCHPQLLLHHTLQHHL